MGYRLGVLDSRSRGLGVNPGWGSLSCVLAVLEIRKKIQVVLMANAGQSRATGPLFFLKPGCPNKVLVVSGNRATTYFGHRSWARHLTLMAPPPRSTNGYQQTVRDPDKMWGKGGWGLTCVMDLHPIQQG